MGEEKGPLKAWLVLKGMLLVMVGENAGVQGINRGGSVTAQPAWWQMEYRSQEMEEELVGGEKGEMGFTVASWQYVH